ELDRFATACRTRPELAGMIQTLFDRLLPHPAGGSRGGESGAPGLANLLEANGFDRTQHESIRADLKSGRIGLLQNRLPPNTKIDDVLPDDVIDATGELPRELYNLGLQAPADGTVA